MRVTEAPQGPPGRRPAPSRRSAPPASPGGGPSAPDPVLFAQLYERFYPRLMAYVLSRVRDHDRAQDVVAETFFRAYLNWGTLRDPNAIGGWLFSTAHNLLVSDLRRNGRHAPWPDPESPQALRWKGPSPEAASLLHDEVDRLFQALGRLSPREQRVLSLRFDARLSNREIAQIVGTTEGNVRVIVFRALRRLRALMGPEE